MKNIWIDGYEANVEQRVGSGRVAFELLKNIERTDYLNNYTILLPSEPLEDLPNTRPGWRYKVVKPNKLWTFIALPLALKRAKRKPDVFFSPTHYIPRFTSVKRVVTVFDTGYLHFPETLKKQDLWKLKNWTKHSLDEAAHIVTISNSSMKDLMQTYGIAQDRITVAYPGYDSEVFRPINDEVLIQKTKSRFGIEGSYIIYIGTIQPRKNLVRLIDAFANIDNLKLVLVGKSKGLGKEGWKYDEILNRPKELGIEEKIIFTGFVPFEDMFYLLSGSKAFILPSLWEGFGIPVVDALAVGKPVIVSNVASLPEIVGDAGILVDPMDVKDIEQTILKVASDKALRESLSKKALVRAQDFSWEKMAEQVIEVLEKVK